ncbi:MAG: hypothetical protein QM813_28205 [Verrucomicrobiota bacterium]
MKSAYELAMERLEKASPTAKLTTEQKKEIAELESKAKAKTAEREIALKEAIATASEAGDFEKVEQLQQQLIKERKAIQADLEEKKERVHQQSKRK